VAVVRLGQVGVVVGRALLLRVVYDDNTLHLLHVGDFEHLEAMLVHGF
jgi:hypothetical protein